MVDIFKGQKPKKKVDLKTGEVKEEHREIIHFMNDDELGNHPIKIEHYKVTKK